MKKFSQFLQEKRKLLGYSVEYVSKKIKVPVWQLIDIENGNWKGFTSPAYLRGIVKKYAASLKIDDKKAQAFLSRELENEEVKFIRTSKYQERGRFFSPSILFYLIILVLSSFFIIQLVIFSQKPKLVIESVKKTIKVSTPLIIKGETEPGALLYLNDEKIYQNAEGEFEEELYLKKGKKVIVVKVLSKNGQESEQVIEVEVK
jgi:cytoskeletal protein RodZ